MSSRLRPALGALAAILVACTSEAGSRALPEDASDITTSDVSQDSDALGETRATEPIPTDTATESTPTDTTLADTTLADTTADTTPTDTTPTDTATDTTPTDTPADTTLAVLAITIAPVAPGVIGTTAFASSTQLSVHLTDSGSADHYRITATEAAQGTSVESDMAASARDLVLGGLRAGTTYDIVASACDDPACAHPARTATASAATATEVWQIGGSGASFTQATPIVALGATLSFGLRMGTDAPAGLAGLMQLYYNPRGSAAWTGGVRIAVSASAASTVSNLTAFTALDAGLEHPCPQPENAASCYPGGGAFVIRASQPVPLASADRVRLFFEATDLASSDQTSRIYALDSADGLTGRDFDPRPDSTVCGASNGKSDFAPGGPCAPTVVIDAGAGAATGLRHARQFRVGMPRTGWRWDMAPGDVMVITGTDNCGHAGDNALFHASWDGQTWSVTKDGQGCAQPIAKTAQGPTMLETAAGEQKLYYRDESAGKQGKKTRIAYVRADVAGNVDGYDIEDWEPVTAHREIIVLWPSGAALSVSESSSLGDYFIQAIDGDLSREVMFMNLGNPSQGLGYALLVNP